MHDKEKRKDFFVKITTVQMMLAALVFLICFLYCRYAQDAGARLSADYKKMTVQDMGLEDFKALFSKEPNMPQEEETTDNINEAIRSEEITTEVLYSIPTENDTAPIAQPDSADITPVMYLAKQLTSSPVFPVAGQISSDFGQRTSPIYGYNENHKGVDIAAGQGSPIRAVMDGIVSDVGYTPGRGNYIILDHKNTEDEKIQTLYQHCSQISATPGTVIRAGETIALVGSTGDSTGPHLHLEYRVNGECLNPIEELFGELYEI